MLVSLKTKTMFWTWFLLKEPCPIHGFGLHTFVFFKGISILSCFLVQSGLHGFQTILRVETILQQELSLKSYRAKKTHALLISVGYWKNVTFSQHQTPPTQHFQAMRRKSFTFPHHFPVTTHGKRPASSRSRPLMKSYHFCQDFLLWCNRWKKNDPNKPKEYPNSNDMIRLLRIGGVWVKHANNSCNFDPRTRLGDKCKEQLAERRNTPKRTFSETTAIWETNVEPW